MTLPYWKVHSSMPETSHGSQGRMPLLERVLELLRSGLPSFEFDEAQWQAQWVAEQRAATRQRKSRSRRRTASARKPKESVRNRASKGPELFEQPGSPEKSASGKKKKARQRARRVPPRSPRPPRVDPVLARCYARLEVSYGAGLAEIRSAWKRLVRKHHPDLHEMDPERKLLGAAVIKEVNNSYEELKRRLRKRA